MNNPKIAQQAAINAVKIAREPLEILRSQVAKPLVEEFGNELESFFGAPRGIRSRDQALAQEELNRARQKQELEKSEVSDNNQSEQQARELAFAMKQEYAKYESKTDRHQTQLRQEMVELQEEIAKLAKTTGVDTKVHMQNPTKKIGIIDIKFLTKIITFLRLKAEESKSAKDLQAQRQNSKRATGMLAWVSGKQMKVHEQGTLHLQG
ncbi:hypothetical protein A3J17_03915 [Candidatus Curtissbacteria bacterium RIFCSPLOWO2_02_FULL_40_11]|uniref:DUF5660 domain-containing protein n=2 Tax=Candidatus Curtissiibacteriota TaxID=1752717 RepID=A0A1F5G6V3_9BACT|nr:MAG: hypothetical protein A2775_02245 [Candidatus Curtissbacteria bacterium RIFCSPHIGHO2_01_FULL_39_57]OGD87588.1 MAG: hypothetical protein A3D04_04905 [Candidatus Curtissbacteria bacterium RIFCSPHIGHO2_02_FULL_40_16b]OGD89970.1 MAG: hypothetical protein A3E11_02440 [Candidatus Curtissbacteria bacterium RIFCSPHIGHO2_12_FULL_38_37]OGE00674.1 MAG: hypothetical protein A3J17_03915 [Candidatus Curtissbacteria bacterium RIFCSPLOWO2_02_FULL_40_11]OGE13355.1 MAG: hypothetical protein A3G14_01620 [C